MSKTHDLKTWPEYFAKVVSKEKTFELRYNDRDYKVGDILRLLEFQPCRPCNGKGSTIVTKHHKSPYDFKMADLYEAVEVCPDCRGSSGSYTGSHANFVVTYVLDKHEAMRDGFVILGLRPYVAGESGALTQQPTAATRASMAAAFMRMGEWIAKGGRLVQGTASAGAPLPNLLRIRCDMTMARPEEGDATVEKRIVVQ